MCSVSVKYILDFEDLVLKKDVNYLIHNFILIRCWNIFNKLGYRKDITKMNLTYFFVLFFNMAPRRFIIIQVVHIIFLLGRADLELSEMCGNYSPMVS